MTRRISRSGRSTKLPTKGMLVLADCAYDSGGLLTAIAATGAIFLVRGNVRHRNRARLSGGGMVRAGHAKSLTLGADAGAVRHPHQEV
jgi:hypothetical protein